MNSWVPASRSVAARPRRPPTVSNTPWCRTRLTAPLRSARQQLHARSAKALEEHFPEVATTQPEVLAHHCAEGGLIEAAVDYWLAAGERALRTSANVEAIKHLTQGLQLLELLPDTPERNRKELLFQTTL